MEAVCGWVKNIIYFMIFISVVNNLLADSKYGKYIHFFAGTVLILLVVKPFAGNLNLDEQITSMFRSISFRNDTDDLKKDLWGMEERRMNQVIGRYEDAVAEDVAAMAREEGLKCTGARVLIDSHRDSSGYGRIEEIELELESGEEEIRETGGRGPGSCPVNVEAGRVHSVKVETVELGEENSGKEAVEVKDEAETEAGDEAEAEAGGENDRIKHLTGKVAQYYGLEEGNIKIRWKDD